MKRSLSELAAELSGELAGDPSAMLSGVASLGDAGPGDLAFVEGPRRAAAARRSRAGCLLVPPGLDVGDRPRIVVADPKLAFARAVATFHPPARPEPGVHPTAVVDRTAELASGVHVGPHATIEANVRIGRDSAIGPGSVVGAGARLGAACRLVARVVVYPGTVLGDRVWVHAGAVLGSDGFGYVRVDGRLEKFPQVGRLVIGDDVEIGANATIDRGALGETRIGRGTKIDNLVQVAHNVVLGEDCALSALSGIAGSATVGDRVTLAGQAGAADHARIGDGATVGAQAAVLTGRPVGPGEVVWGTPARPLGEQKRLLAELARLPGLRRRVEALERALERVAPGREPGE